MSDDGMAMSSAHNPLNSTVNNSVRISVPPVGDAAAKGRAAMHPSKHSPPPPPRMSPVSMCPQRLDQ